MRKYFACLLLLAAGHAPAQPLNELLARWDRDSRPDLRSVLVMRDGAVAAERYYNGESADSLHDIRSAGKSITALLAGAAADRGKLRAQDRIDRLWPAAGGTALAGMTLDQVLTMRSGHKKTHRVGGVPARSWRPSWRRANEARRYGWRKWAERYNAGAYQVNHSSYAEF